jgi:glycosyltransferase involved in cell wall biosynthesis
MPVFSRIVALTQVTAEQIVEKYHVDPCRVTSILDGVDERFWRPQPQIPVDPQLIVSLGQARRDYDTLIQAVNGLPLQLHIQASSQWYVRYKTQIGDLPHNVSFGSYLPFSRLRDLYAQSNLVVVALTPGAHHSAGSVTIKEAMAMGKAVIVASPGGAEDYIDHGETGIIIPAGNGLALRDAIRDLMATPALIKRMGENARHVVETELAYERKIRRMVAEANGE